MKIGAWHYTDFCNVNNNLFSSTDVGIGDDALLGTVCLAKRAELDGIHIEIADLNNIDQYDALIAFDIFWKNKSWFKLLTKNHYRAYKKFLQFKGRRLLILHECDVVHSENWQHENHEMFDRIFTWNDDLIDGIKYFKLNCAPRRITSRIRSSNIKESKFSSIVCSNIKNNSEGALIHRLMRSGLRQK